MARVIRGEHILQEKSFALYSSPVGQHANIAIRRKVGEPCDTLHPNSLALRLQRNRFSKAAKDWAALTYQQKQYWKKRLEYH